MLPLPVAAFLEVLSLPRPLQKLKNDLIYYAVRVFLFFLDLFPYKLLQLLGEEFGRLVFFLAVGERRKTIKNLHLAYGGKWTEKEIKRVALNVLKKMGQNLFEVLRWRNWSPKKLISLVARTNGMENMEKALKRGKGVLAVTAHLGNWEILTCVAGFHFPGKMTVVARQLYDPRFDRLITDFRRSQGVEVVQRGLALRGMLSALKQNHIVAVLCDQDTGRDGVFVPFFGVEAWTQSGPARIAYKTGAALIPSFVVRGGDGQYEVHVEKEIEVPHTGNEEKDILETVRRYTGIIETFVRAYPDQWVWMHERWKTRPSNENLNDKA